MKIYRYGRLYHLLTGLFILFLGASSSMAQTGSVTGLVRDVDSGETLSGVNVTLQGTSSGAATNQSGRFTIDHVAAGEYTVRVSLLGYEPVDRTIRVRDGETVVLSIELSEQAVEMGEFTIVDQRSRFIAETVTTATKIGAAPIETPYSLSVITRDQLDLQAVDNLAQALRYAPGTQGERWGLEPRFTWVSIRGFDVSQTGLYRDGLQLRNPSFITGYNLEPYGAERIEILRGPASVLYGAGDPGGIVSFITKRPTRVTLGEVELAAGNFARLEGKLDLGGPLAKGSAFSYRLTGLFRDSETQVDHVGNDRIFVAPAVAWENDRGTSLTLLGHYQHDETVSSQALPIEGTLESSSSGKIPVNRFTGEPGVDQYERTEYAVSALLEHRFSPALSLHQKTRYYHSDLDDVTVYSTGLRADGRTLDRSIFGSFGTLGGLVMDQYVQASFESGWMDYTLLGGVDFQKVDATSHQTYGAAPTIDIFNPTYGQAVDNPPVYSDTEPRLSQLGLYFQSQFAATDRLILSLNARYDRAHTETVDNLQSITSEQDDHALTGRAGIVYKSAFGLAPYISYAESFQPTLGTDSRGETFEPERGRQLEAGLKFQPKGINSFVTFAVYDLVRENFLQYDPSTYLPVQTGEIRSRGVEVEGTASLWVGLDVIAGLTFQDVEITESAVQAEIGERPTQVPERSASLWANYTFHDGPLSGLGLGAGVRYLGSTFGNLPNTLVTPAATLTDAALFYQWNRFRLSLNVQNLFDEEYVAAAFERSSTLVTFGPARQFVAGLQYSW